MKENMKKAKKLNRKVFDIIDRTQVTKFITWLLLLITYSAILLFFLSLINQGITPTFLPDGGKQITIWDTLYFSVITVSSLGYGDYRPEGIGRLIVSVEVLSGLGLFSIIIAKLASERQGILIRLLYASDTERRIKAFTKDVTEYRYIVSEWIPNYINKEVKIKHLKSLKRLLGGISSYLLYHATEGVLLHVSPESYLRRLFKELFKLQEVMLLHAKGLNTPTGVSENLISRSNKIADIATSYKEWSTDQGIKAQCEEIVRRAATFNHEKKVQQLQLNDALFKAILDVLPNAPPAPADSAFVSEKLEISKTLASKALAELRLSILYQEVELDSNNASCD